MDNEDWGAEYSKLADLYAVKCKEVRELQAQNKKIRADAIEECINALGNNYWDIAKLEQLKEQK